MLMNAGWSRHCGTYTTEAYYHRTRGLLPEHFILCFFLITHLHKDANVAKILKVWPLPPNTCGSESIIISLGRKRKSVVETSFKSDPLLPYLSSLNAKQS